MADKRITTELVIKASDQYSSRIKAMSQVTGGFADKVRRDMRGLQNLRGPLKMIDDYKRAHSVFGKSEAALDKQRKTVAELRRELRATERPTKKMTQDFERAQRAAERLRLAHDKNGQELTSLRGKLKTAGVNTGDLAGEQRRLTGALRSSNVAFERQTERLERLRVMQDRTAASRKLMDRSLATASNLSIAGGSSFMVGRAVLQRTSAVANRSGGRQQAFTGFQNLTGADDERMARLRTELSDLRGVTKRSVDEMLAALGVLVGKGMDLEDALGALPATARAAFATETGSDEMGAAGFALYDNLNIAPEELRKAYDIMAKGGKEGGFELDAMARKFPEITAGARALKMEGLESVAELTAALQIAMKAAGSEDQAATNMANFIGKLTAPVTVKKFAEAGISIQEELQKAMESGVSPMEHMLALISKMTGGDALEMGKLFEDKQVLDFLRAMIPNMEEYARIRDEAFGAEGTVDADLDRRMLDFNTQKGQLKESLGDLFTLSPETLEVLTEMMERADAFVEKLIEWKEENPEFAKGLFLGAAALGALTVAAGGLLLAGGSILGFLAVGRFALSGFGARAAFAGGDLLDLTRRVRGLNRTPMNLRRPNFRSHVGDFRNFRTSAASELTGLSLHADRKSAAISRSLSRIRWRASFAAVNSFLALQNIPKDPKDLASFQEKNYQSMDRLFRKVPGISHMMSGYEAAFEKVQGHKPPIEGTLLPDNPGVRSSAKIIQSYAGEVNLPTEARIAKLKEDAAVYRAEIEAAQAALDANPEFASGITNPNRVLAQADLTAAQAGLRAVEDQLASAEAASLELQGALMVLNDTSVAPVIDTQSIDAALQKVSQLAAQLRSMPSASAGASSPKPAGARRTGGPVQAGLPYEVNEDTPRSEWFVPSVSGGILNVSQAQSAMRSSFKMPPNYGVESARRAQQLRAKARAVVFALPAALSVGAAGSAAAAAGGASGKSMSARVEIGSISIVAPSGVSDPRGLVDLIKAELGAEVEAVFRASFSD